MKKKIIKKKEIKKLAYDPRKTYPKLFVDFHPDPPKKDKYGRQIKKLKEEFLLFEETGSLISKYDVLVHLLQGGPKNAEEIIKAINIPPNHVAKYIYTLKKNGFVIEKNKKNYVLVKQGTLHKAKKTEKPITNVNAGTPQAHFAQYAQIAKDKPEKATDEKLEFLVNKIKDMIKNEPLSAEKIKNIVGPGNYYAVTNKLWTEFGVKYDGTNYSFGKFTDQDQKKAEAKFEAAKIKTLAKKAEDELKVLFYSKKELEDMVGSSNFDAVMDKLKEKWIIKIDDSGDYHLKGHTKAWVGYKAKTLDKLYGMFNDTIGQKIHGDSLFATKPENKSNEEYLDDIANFGIQLAFNKKTNEYTFVKKSFFPITSGHIEDKAASFDWDKIPHWKQHFYPELKDDLTDNHKAFSEEMDLFYNKEYAKKLREILKNSTVKWDGPHDNEEIAALTFYSGHGHASLNKALYAGTEHADGYVKEQDEKISNAIKKTPPLKEDLVVYSGLKIADPRENMDESGIFHVPAYMSTSLKLSTASDFSSSVQNPKGQNVTHIVRIKVPKGTKCTYLPKISKHPTEEEVLLHKGSKIKLIKGDVVKTTWGTTKILWDAELVHDGIQD